MSPADFTLPGVVRITGWPGLWHAVEPCQDRSQSGNWWVLPCSRDGGWNRKEGWRAAHPDRMSAPPPVRTRRHYKKRSREATG